MGIIFHILLIYFDDSIVHEPCGFFKRDLQIASGKLQVGAYWDIGYLLRKKVNLYIPQVVGATASVACVVCVVSNRATGGGRPYNRIVIDARGARLLRL